MTSRLLPLAHVAVVDRRVVGFASAPSVNKINSQGCAVCIPPKSLERTGLGSDRDAKEATNTAFNFLKASGSQISGSISTTTKDYIINYQDLNGIGMTKFQTLPSVIALASSALSKPTLSGLAVLGEISISGAKKVLLPITSAPELGSVPSDLIGAFSLIFYLTPQEAVFKALGVE